MHHDLVIFVNQLSWLREYLLCLGLCFQKHLPMPQPLFGSYIQINKNVL